MKRKDKMRKRSELLKGNEFVPYSDLILNRKKRGVTDTTSRKIKIKY